MGRNPFLTMNKPKYQIGDRVPPSNDRICPECGRRSLYLSDAFTYVCGNWECDEHFPVECFIDDEPEFYDNDGDKIVY